MRKLEVRLYGKTIGHIAETRKGGRFAYTPEAVRQYQGMPLLSVSLPVKARPFGESKTQNWFEGLLPEGERRDRACRQLGVNRYDWIGLLAEIGWECAGAVQIFPEGGKVACLASYEPLALGDLAMKLLDVAKRSPAPEGKAFRMSLGGFQDKLCVAMSRLGDASFIVPDEIAIPIGEAPSSHILKPEPREYPGLAESEAWAMSVASCAARASKVAVLAFDGAPNALVAERYDRAGSYPAQVKRLHQEDACQALGLAPSRKYAATTQPKGDDPTYKAIANLLALYSIDSFKEQMELFRQMVVSVALGNWDAHAKNTSLLYEDGRLPRLAPLYDVVPIAEVEPRTNFLPMRIDGTLDPNVVTGERLVAEAHSWGLEQVALEKTLSDCVTGLEAGMEFARKRYPKAAMKHEPATVERLRRLKI